MGWYELESFSSGKTSVAVSLGRTAEGSDFESRYDGEFPLLYIVQTGSGAHAPSYLMGPGGFFPRNEAAGV
jgi:hypothetical protein